MGLSDVFINFHGICTHMDNHDRTILGVSGVASVPVEFRVVLVDAGTEDSIRNSRLFDAGIAPHTAKLQLLVDEIESMSDVDTGGFGGHQVVDDKIWWRLKDVVLTVANALPGPAALELTALPHLKDLCTDLGPANPWMTRNIIPTRAAAYFDFFSGRIECRSFGVEDNAAAVARVTCTTLGKPQLRVRSFASAQEILSITLRPGATIAVSNIPEPPHPDGPNDFLLHFLNAASFPENLQTPGPCNCPRLDPANIPVDAREDFTTPSCSNSTYP